MKILVTVFTAIAIVIFCGLLLLSIVGAVLTIIGAILGVLGMVLPFLIGAAIIGYAILLLIDKL